MSPQTQDSKNVMFLEDLQKFLAKTYSAKGNIMTKKKDKTLPFTFSVENTNEYFTPIGEIHNDDYFAPIEEATMPEHEPTLSLVQQALLNVLPRASRAKSHLAYLSQEDWAEVLQASKNKVATLIGLYQALEAQFTISQTPFYANYKQFYVHYTRARKLLAL
jgi:hypothetical protein